MTADTQVITIVSKDGRKPNWVADRNPEPDKDKRLRDRRKKRKQRERERDG